MMEFIITSLLMIVVRVALLGWTLMLTLSAANALISPAIPAIGFWHSVVVSLPLSAFLYVASYETSGGE